MNLIEFGKNKKSYLKTVIKLIKNSHFGVEIITLQKYSIKKRFTSTRSLMDRSNYSMELKQFKKI
jgi:hypothetical protein